MAFANGTFSLYTPGNPVVTGTTIASSWANNTLSDIATGLTSLGRSITSSVTAAGSSQGTATEVTSFINYISSVPSAGNGVVLDDSATVTGQTAIQIVYNSSLSNYLVVYPPSGEAINGLPANTGFILPPRTSVMCLLVTATQWIALMSA